MSNTTFSTSKFEGARGHSIYLSHWKPVDNVRAVVVLVHGVGEHALRYDEVAKALNDIGVEVYATDHQGHGRSGGNQGTVEKFSDFLDDTETLVSMARTEHSGKPVILLGHSMGGLIATAYVLEKETKPDMLVLSGPAIVPIIDPNDRTIDATKLSRDPVEQEKYLSDPLILRERVQEDLYLKLADGVGLLPGRSGEITMPVLLIHGTDDALCSAEGAQMYVESSGSNDVTVKLYPEGRHEMFNEVNKAEVIADLLAWIQARV